MMSNGEAGEWMLYKTDEEEVRLELRVKYDRSIANVSCESKRDK
jgi:hypothetical protein